MRYLIRHLRLSPRFFGFALFLALVVMVVSTSSLAAQVPAASPSPSAAAPVTQAGTAAKPPVTKDGEEDDVNVYRHAPVVHSLAKLLHLKLETTARIFEAINFVIIALAIGIPLVRFLPRVIRKRSQTLRHNIESARQVTQDANTRLSAVEARLSKLDEEIAQIRAHVEEEGKQDEARIKATLEEESVRIVTTAEQEIAVAAAHARRGLRHFAADLAIDQASKQLVLTPEADRDLIAEFVRDVAKRGQN